VAKTMRDSVVAWRTSAGNLPNPALRLHAGFGQDFSASMPVFVEETAFFGTTFGQVYAIDVAAQRVRWVYRLGNEMVNTPCAVKRRGVLVSSSDGKLALLRINTSKMTR
jgi:outer membrane protein assembly factor BamB